MAGPFAQPVASRIRTPTSARYDPAMIGLSLLMLTSFTAAPGDGLRLEFDSQMRSRVVESIGAAHIAGPFTYSETLLTADGELRNFALGAHEEADVNDEFGMGHAVRLSGRAGSITKRVEVASYPAWPRW